MVTSIERSRLWIARAHAHADNRCQGLQQATADRFQHAHYSSRSVLRTRRGIYTGRAMQRARPTGPPRLSMSGGLCLFHQSQKSQKPQKAKPPFFGSDHGRLVLQQLSALLTIPLLAVYHMQLPAMYLVSIFLALMRRPVGIPCCTGSMTLIVALLLPPKGVSSSCWHLRGTFFNYSNTRQFLPR